jgi:hypothetical protein
MMQQHCKWVAGFVGGGVTPNPKSSIHNSVFLILTVRGFFNKKRGFDKGASKRATRFQTTRNMTVPASFFFLFFFLISHVLRSRGLLP